MIKTLKVERIFLTLLRVEFRAPSLFAVYFTCFYVHFMVFFVQMDENALKKIIAKNIIFYRKAMKWTQAELAEKLNYSDKAVSKWERAEAIPDVSVLKTIADLFGITLDDLTKEHTESEKVRVLNFNISKAIIPFLAGGLVWLIACIAFVVWFMVAPNTPKLWLIFIYALPVTCIVLLVFSILWGKRWMPIAAISALIWTTALALFLTLLSIEYSYLIFLIAVPLQIIAALWTVMRWKSKKK